MGLKDFECEGESQDIQEQLNALLAEIDKSFPDKIIVWSEWKHEEWDSTASYLCNVLGYPNGRSFLSAYGYRIAKDYAEYLEISNKSISNVCQTKEKKSRSHLLTIILLTVVAVLVFVMALPILFGNNGRQYIETLPVEEKEKKNVDTIDIPGYEILTFEAGKTKQSVSLANPKQNTCTFIISLVLEDGTELWKSEEIKPGENSKAIVFTKALDAGTYPNAMMKYQCFRLDSNRTPLNGAETKLTIIVK